MSEKAVFLNRDQTLLQANGIIASPEKVALAATVPALLRRLREADYRIVVVTNQPGVARGQFDEDTLVAIHERIQELLSEHSAPLDAIYYCPFLDSEEATVAQYRVNSNLRKPKPGMHLQAAADLDLDLAASWMIGRTGDDIQSGLAAGCKTILLDANGKGEPSQANHVVKNLRQAVDLICRVEPVKAGPSQPAETRPENLLA